MTADALYQIIMAAFVEHWPDEHQAFLDAVRPYATEPAYPEAMARAFATTRETARHMFQHGDMPAETFRAIAERDHAMARGGREQ
jgi:hypothetical protein